MGFEPINTSLRGVRVNPFTNGPEHYHFNINMFNKQERIDYFSILSNAVIGCPQIGQR